MQEWREGSHLNIDLLAAACCIKELSSSWSWELGGWAELRCARFSAWTNRLGDREAERRPSSLDRSSPNKMPLSDLLLLLLLPSCYSPPSNNLQRVWAYIIKGAISPISSEIPRFGEKSYICTRQARRSFVYHLKNKIAFFFQFATLMYVRTYY